jgi:hypothetical protein
MAQDDFAIVVGIDRYPNLTSVGQLQGTENDVDNFYNWLVSTKGDVPSNQITRITSATSSQPDCPDIKEIDAAFTKLLQLNLSYAGGSRVGRRLYIYCSGHGIAPQPDEAALLAANCSPLLLGDHIAARVYTNVFRLNGRFEQIVVFMDCCREIRTKCPIRPAPFVQGAYPGPSTVTYFGFATTGSSVAREVTVNKKMQGVFTTALVEALELGEIDGQQLSEYVTARMPALLSGVSKPDIESNDQFVFSEGAAKAKIPITFEISPAYQNSALDLYQSRSVIKTLKPAGSATLTEDLEGGNYALTDGAVPLVAFGVTGNPDQKVQV